MLFFDNAVKKLKRHFFILILLLPFCLLGMVIYFYFFHFEVEKDLNNDELIQCSSKISNEQVQQIEGLIIKVEELEAIIIGLERLIVDVNEHNQFYKNMITEIESKMVEKSEAEYYLEQLIDSGVDLKCM